jgi:hypothetical protein
MGRALSSFSIHFVSYDYKEHTLVTNFGTSDTTTASYSSVAYSENSVSTPPTSTTAATESVEYDSDRTDFLETPATPCPKRRRQTGSTSHHFANSRARKASSSVRRKLDFCVRSASLRTTSKMGFLPEYSPAHKWTNIERQSVNGIVTPYKVF